MSGTSPKRRVTFLFDVDNTLIDNDRAKKDLSARIAELLGVAGSGASGSCTRRSDTISDSSISRSSWRAMMTSSTQIFTR